MFVLRYSVFKWILKKHFELKFLITVVCVVQCGNCASNSEQFGLPQQKPVQSARRHQPSLPHLQIHSSHPPHGPLHWTEYVIPRIVEIVSDYIMNQKNAESTDSNIQKLATEGQL